jgi:GDP-L-fucose synthase
MEKDSKIYIAGAQGMVGSAIVRRLRDGDYKNLLTPDRGQLDLLDQQAVADFFAAESPDYVFMAAAKVGGIHANSTYPAAFIHENLVIQSNVIEQAHRHHVKRLLFLGSSCIYPKKAPQPMSEDVLLTGLLEPTNEPYAIAKIAGIKMCESYNRQYGTQFVAVMPTNLYGPADNFHPENSHVLPALMRRFHEAKCERQPEVVVWGTGAPMREFLYVDDMADGCVFVMEMDDQALSDELLSYPKPCFVNLGAGMDVTIHELAETIKNVVGFAGDIVFDPSKPDGTMRKLLDVSRMKALGWEAKVSLRDGIDKTYEWFLNHQACFRA